MTILYEKQWKDEYTPLFGSSGEGYKIITKNEARKMVKGLLENYQQETEKRNMDTFMRDVVSIDISNKNIDDINENVFLWEVVAKKPLMVTSHMKKNHNKDYSDNSEFIVSLIPHNGEERVLVVDDDF